MRQSRSYCREKGVLHNASSSVAMVATGERLFASLPFYHTYGLTCSVLGPLIVGTHLCINGSLKTMMRDLRLFQPDTMMTVPLTSKWFTAGWLPPHRKEGWKKS